MADPNRLSFEQEPDEAGSQLSFEGDPDQQLPATSPTYAEETAKKYVQANGGQPIAGRPLDNVQEAIITQRTEELRSDFADAHRTRQEANLISELGAFTAQHGRSASPTETKEIIKETFANDSVDPHLFEKSYASRAILDSLLNETPTVAGQRNLQEDPNGVNFATEFGKDALARHEITQKVIQKHIHKYEDSSFIDAAFDFGAELFLGVAWKNVRDAVGDIKVDKGVFPGSTIRQVVNHLL